MNSSQGYEIAYREALRAISDQQTAVDSVQSRVGFVASAGVIELSLIAQRIQDPGRTKFSLWVAVALFLLLVICSAYALWPRRDWRFHFGVDRLHSEYIEHAEPLSASLMMRDLAIHLDRYFRSNAVRIDKISLAFAISLIALAAQTALFAYDVTGGQ